MIKLSLLLSLFLIGCSQPGKEPGKIPTADTSLKTVDENPVTDPERVYIEAEFDEHMKNMLDSALLFAKKNRDRDSFTHIFEKTSRDNMYVVTTDVCFGYLLEPSRKHLLIERRYAWGASYNIFLLHNGTFKPLLENQPPSDVTSDTLKDVNGDGYKDFVVHWYPSSGCCRRDVYNVFLYRRANGHFTEKYVFTNPTFYPTEKVIRGVKYGHPGEVPLYKYKWNGLQVDTVEFIYPYSGNKGKFIRTKDRTYSPTKEHGVVLNSLPVEYRDIESIDWFLHY